MIRYRRAADHRSRAQRWRDAVAVLIALQAEYRTWLEALPDNLQDRATARALEAIDELDLDELQAIEPPEASAAISAPPRAPPIGLPRWANRHLPRAPLRRS